MKFLIYIIVSIFVFQPLAMSRTHKGGAKKSSHSKHQAHKKAAGKKHHGGKKHAASAGRWKGSENRKPASIQKNKKSIGKSSKRHHRASYGALPPKRMVMAHSYRTSYRYGSQQRRRPASYTVPNHRMYSGYSDQGERNSVSSVLALVNGQERHSSLDEVNIFEMDSQAAEDVEFNGTKNVRGDRARMTDEDPVSNERM